jgi:peptide/nickel transport system substrate-binding protein
MIKSYDQRTLTLVRNPRFQEWSAAAQPDGYPDRIAYRFGTPAMAQVNAVEQGAADYTSVTPDLIGALRTGGHGSQLHTNPTINTDFFFLSTKLAPFNNSAVRRALNYAVDRNRLAQLDTARSGNPTRPSCQVLPPNSVGYARYCLYQHDLAKAKRLVAASGTSGQAVTVWASAPAKAISSYFVSVLRSLGYKAQLKVLSPDQKYFATVLSGRRQFQTGIAGWNADIRRHRSSSRPY